MLGGKLQFRSDNRAGVANQVAAAISEAGLDSADPYGGDSLTADVREKFSRLFEQEVAVFFATTGTAANVMGLSAIARPGGIVFCHEDAHINTDEGGAAEFLADVKLIGLGGDGGKITGEVLAEAVQRYPPDPIRYGQPVALSISNLTEWGTAYSPAEVAELGEIAHGAGLAVHMDGARFANALAGQGTSPADLTWRAGIDILSFGGTKNGCWLAEAVVFFDPARAVDFEFIRKRTGHLISKQSFIAAQFDAYLADNLWLDLARHANGMAKKLETGIVGAGGRMAWPVQGNEVFAILRRDAIARAREAGAAFYDWDTERGVGGAAPAGDEAIVRLVASFVTRDDEVAAFVDALQG